MRMQRGDVLDRLSILLLKIVHADSNKESFFDETREYLIELGNIDPKRLPYETFLLLLEVNCQIWDLEASIRNGDELPLEEVGRRAIVIRNLNKKRVNLRNQINDYKEIKVLHASEELYVTSGKQTGNATLGRDRTGSQESDQSARRTSEA